MRLIVVVELTARFTEQPTDQQLAFHSLTVSEVGGIDGPGCAFLRPPRVLLLHRGQRDIVFP